MSGVYSETERSSVTAPASIDASRSHSLKKLRWAGRALSAAAVAFLLVDGVIKLIPISAVSETLSQLGFPTTPGFERGLGCVGLACTVVYAIPRTTVLGAILLTGYLGGAMSAQLRVGNPVFSHLLFGAYLGVAVWGGLWLRMPAIRLILPIARKDQLAVTGTRLTMPK